MSLEPASGKAHFTKHTPPSRLAPTTGSAAAACDCLASKEVGRWDRVGSWLSALCALHCVIAPFVTLSLPFWVYTLHYSPVHLALAIFVIPIGTYTFWHGYQHHQKKSIVAIGLAGLVLLTIGLLSPRTREQLRWNDILTLTASVLLIIAHALNRWTLRKQ
jgi:drug/metabolite transporter (DMT)-like permease